MHTATGHTDTGARRHAAQWRRDVLRCQVAVLLLLPVVACASDAPAPTAVRTFDTSRVVEVEAVSCTNRLRRGQAVQLGDGVYLTAAHTVAESRQVTTRSNVDGPTVEIAAVSIDDRTDLALLVVDAGGVPDDVSLDEWVDSDPTRSALMVTARRQRTVGVSAPVIVRATSPDGSRREWQGVRLEARAAPGESGAAVVQDGLLIGLVVKTERADARSLSIASQEIRDFLSIRLPLHPSMDGVYSPRIQSHGGSTPAVPVGSTCR